MKNIYAKIIIAGFCGMVFSIVGIKQALASDNPVGNATSTIYQRESRQSFFVGNGIISGTSTFRIFRTDGGTAIGNITFTIKDGDTNLTKEQANICGTVGGDYWQGGSTPVSSLSFGENLISFSTWGRGSGGTTSTLSFMPNTYACITIDHGDGANNADRVYGNITDVYPDGSYHQENSSSTPFNGIYDIYFDLGSQDINTGSSINDNNNEKLAFLFLENVIPTSSYSGVSLSHFYYGYQLATTTATAVKFRFELSASSTFNQPIGLETGWHLKNAGGGTHIPEISSFDVTNILPLLIKDRAYYWRIKAYINFKTNYDIISSSTIFTFTNLEVTQNNFLPPVYTPSSTCTSLEFAFGLNGCDSSLNVAFANCDFWGLEWGGCVYNVGVSLTNFTAQKYVQMLNAIGEGEIAIGNEVKKISPLREVFLIHEAINTAILAASSSATKNPDLKIDIGIFAAQPLTIYSSTTFSGLQSSSTRATISEYMINAINIISGIFLLIVSILFLRSEFSETNNNNENKQ